ncbi:MAG TPA: DUF1993 domain-containing protein [Thermoanaerobaculia bacterium]|nr:DUF1993 domain-containing protein [Thermoanaerobaculia bacterium]
MSNLIYDLSIAPMSRSLKNLDAILAKAEEHAEADDGIEPSTLIQARLHPNMRPLVFQIQVATDTAKGAAARLTGREVPSWPDEEETFADLHARVGKAIDYLSGFRPEDFEGAEDREIRLQLGPNAHDFTGRTYLAGFVIPNFYFHVTTAYSILRHNGVVIGKRDFLGGA